MEFGGNPLHLITMELIEKSYCPFRFPSKNLTPNSRSSITPANTFTFVAVEHGFPASNDDIQVLQLCRLSSSLNVNSLHQKTLSTVKTLTTVDKNHHSEIDIYDLVRPHFMLGPGSSLQFLSIFKVSMANFVITNQLAN